LNLRRGRVLENVDVQPVIRVEPIRVVLDDADDEIVLPHEIGREVQDVDHPAGQKQPDPDRRHQSSTTWVSKTRRWAAQRVRSNPAGPSESTAAYAMASAWWVLSWAKSPWRPYERTLGRESAQRSIAANGSS